MPYRGSAILTATPLQERIDHDRREGLLCASTPANSGEPGVRHKLRINLDPRREKGEQICLLEAKTSSPWLDAENRLLNHVRVNCRANRNHL